MEESTGTDSSQTGKIEDYLYYQGMQYLCRRR